MNEVNAALNGLAQQTGALQEHFKNGLAVILLGHASQGFVDLLDSQLARRVGIPIAYKPVRQRAQQGHLTTECQRRQIGAQDLSSSVSVLQKRLQRDPI
jgi:hypothetical protein